MELHGGPDKSPYVHPAEHYAYWQRELDRPLRWARSART
jgi:MOSC domain-containing protein YiiM